MKKHKIACIAILGSIISLCLIGGNDTQAKSNEYEAVSSIGTGNTENRSLLLSLIVSNNEKKTEEEIVEEIEELYECNSLDGILFDFEAQGMADKVRVYVYESKESMEDGKLWFEEDLY